MIDDLAAALVEADATMRGKWDRSLPIPDLIGDRWERAQRLGFGEGSSIYDSVIVLGDVRVGRDVWIGPNVMLDGSGGTLAIGDGCNISTGVQLYTHDTVRRCLSGGVADRDTAPVTIGACTYIGPLAIVTAGAVIGSMCVIAAGALVKGEVPDRTIVGGVPARVLGKVEGDGADVRLVY